MNEKVVTIIGAGLAGSEAAYQLASRGIEVKLYEMRPQKKTEAHITSNFAELVCSNSFGSDTEHSASRILKDELEQLHSFVLKTGREFSVPAGNSLAIDRELFSKKITETLEALPNIQIFREEKTDISPTDITLIATGPLTSSGLAQSLTELLGEKSLFFYDAISPIVTFESLDLSKMFYASRYDKGEPDFINIPLTKEEYENFVQDLLTADVVLPHDFEESKYFESCLPIEVIASRGLNTLAFGPMKPVGLRDPKTQKRAHAVIQLRAENKFKTAYNLVGFQTKMKYAEQTRVFKKLPGLENAEFVRLGSLHRNTFVNSPKVLNSTLNLKRNENVFLAGQITGTEGYVESIATGLIAGLNIYNQLKNRPLFKLPETTMVGALLSHITNEQLTNFQPTNVNFGLFPPLDGDRKILKDKKIRNELFSKRSKEAIDRVQPNNTV